MIAVSMLKDDAETIYKIAKAWRDVHSPEEFGDQWVEMLISPLEVDTALEELRTSIDALK